MRRRKHKVIDPPAERREAAESQPAVRQFRQKPGVLVVDDEHLVRIMVQLGLERSNFDVWLASSGREAIHLYRKHRERIDVVLLDVRMAGLDGPQTLDVLRELNPQVRVCFMTGDANAYQPEELRQRGAAHVIAKPFNLEQLANILQLLVNGVPTERISSGEGCQG
jgi:CheY-like chemotaxis protein